MCFYSDDYDWVAMVNEISDKPAERQTTCYECGADIHVGDIARFVHQQESQECQCEWCQFGRLDPDWGGGVCEQNYGESFDCVVCGECIKLLKAIEAYEIAEGCPEYARQPLYGELCEVFWSHQQHWEYAEKSVEMYPELIEHRFIRLMLTQD